MSLTQIKQKHNQPLRHWFTARLSCEAWSGIILLDGALVTLQQSMGFPEFVCLFVCYLLWGDHSFLGPEPFGEASNATQRTTEKVFQESEDFVRNPKNLGEDIN